MSSGVFFAAALGVLLAALGSRLPWTRAGGAALAAGLVGWVGLRGPRLADWAARADSREWAALAFGAVAIVVVWWSLHRGQGSKKPDERPSAVEPRVAGVGVGIVAVMAAAWALPPELPAAGTYELPWFFAGLGELARWIGPFSAFVLLPAVAFVCLAAAPHLDTRETETPGRFRGRGDEVLFFLFAWIFLGLLPMLKAVLLRPKLPTADPLLQPLSRLFWVDLLGMPRPDLWLVRELPGLAALALLFFVLPWKLPDWKPTRGAFSRHKRRLGRRYWPACLLVAAVVQLVAAVSAGSLLGVGPWLDVSGGPP